MFSLLPTDFEILAWVQGFPDESPEKILARAAAHERFDEIRSRVVWAIQFHFEQPQEETL